MPNPFHVSTFSDTANCVRVALCDTDQGWAFARQGEPAAVLIGDSKDDPDEPARLLAFVQTEYDRFLVEAKTGLLDPRRLAPGLTYRSRSGAGDFEVTRIDGEDAERMAKGDEPGAFVLSHYQEHDTDGRVQLVFTAGEWAAFLAAVEAGEFDRDRLPVGGTYTVCEEYLAGDDPEPDGPHEA